MTVFPKTSCLVAAVCSGCLYIEPAWRPNEPPVLVEPAVAPGEAFVFDLDVSSFLFVVIRDPDSPEIQCEWVVPDLEVAPVTYCTADDDSEWVSTLVLPYDLSLDGEIVQARLFDPSSRTQITVDFQILVGGEF